MDFRIAVLMERLGVKDANVVREQLERYDAARIRTMRAYFSLEREDPRLYHIVLNTQRLSIEACVKVISKLAEGNGSQGSTAIQSALADKLFEAEINSALAEHISFVAAPLGVSVSVKGFANWHLLRPKCAGALAPAFPHLSERLG
jgi:hypothetical protein